MQQLEDLSRIIREKDKMIEERDQEIADLKEQNMNLQAEIREIKNKAADAAGKRGNDLLLNSSMKDKMMDDPRYRKLVEEQEAAAMAAAMGKS